MILYIAFIVGLYLDSVLGCSGTPFTCSTPTTFADRRPNKSVLSIATFNAEWLFWDNGNGGPSRYCPRNHASGTCPWADKTAADDHLAVVAEKLVSINADIIALVEVQDCVVLNCLIAAMGDNTYKPYLIPGKDTATDQNVAIISRVDPITALTRNEMRATIDSADSSCGAPDGSYDSGVSKHFISRFNIAGLGRISLIGLHFLAFPTEPDRCIRREAQATVISSIAQIERDAGFEPVILGDFNDYDGDLLDASNSVPTSRVLKLLKEEDNVKIMYNVVEKISTRSQRYSSWWDKDSDCLVEPGELTLIDHLLVSSNLWSRVSTVNLYNLVVEECNSYQSDHYPIKVTFYTDGVQDADISIQSKLTLDSDSVSSDSSGTWVSNPVTIILISLGVILTISLIVLIVLKRQKIKNEIISSYGTFEDK